MIITVLLLGNLTTWIIAAASVHIFFASLLKFNPLSELLSNAENCSLTKPDGIPI